MAVGRISGPLLKANLLRDGIDLAFETDLLYLDVNNRRIGINTTSPTHDLFVNDTTRTINLEMTGTLNIGNLSVYNNTIQSNVNILNLLPAGGNGIVYHGKVTVNDIDIVTNTISTNSTNTNLEIRPNGTGRVEVYSDTFIDGNLHATGNITADGNIVIGDQNTDNVVINADVDSDIIPNITDTYDLGSASQRWNNVWTNNFIATNVYAQNIIVDSIDISLEQGNIYYVAANGNDSHTGKHQQNPLATLKYALSLATAGDTILIYPGVYQEVTPLSIPKGVTVKGISFRNVIIEPDTSSTHEDVFLLDGEVTIEDLTIRGHYYNSIANTGHAFRFKNGFKITSRSPYIRNISIITTGSLTTTNDPRGFDSGDAGRGAYLDGSVVDPTTLEASCLFNAVTFLCPGVDCLTMLNGIRVEFINSFIYWADKGMYILNGTGRTLQDGSTKQYGAEIRCIGCANIYGNYGIHGNGNAVKVYLTEHNFSYIGSGKSSANNPAEVIQANEVIKLNSAKIYYLSVDQKGNVRIGDLFYIDQETGNIVFSNGTVNVNGPHGINLTTGPDTTILRPDRIEIDNLKFSGNLIESQTGNITFTAFDDNINLQNNVNITGDLDVTGNVTIGGNITIGDQTTDTINFVAGINSNLIPRIGATYNLGSSSLQWKDLWLRTAHISDIEISTNYIRTTASNADLELYANGTGGIKIEDITVNQNVVSVPTNTNIELKLTGTGIVDVNSDKAIRLPRGTTLQRPAFPQAGMIRYNTDNNNYEGYNGTYWIVLNGLYDVDQNTKITAELTPGANDNTFRFYANNVQVADLDNTRLNVIKVDIDNITIDNNTITTYSNQDLTITAQGTGKVNVENFSFKNNVITNTIANSITELQHTGSGYFKIAGTTGFVIPVGDANQRPITPIKGFMRYNTDDDRVEIFDGTVWQGAAGSSVGVSVPAATEIAILSALMVG